MVWIELDCLRSNNLNGAAHRADDLEDVSLAPADFVDALHELESEGVLHIHFYVEGLASSLRHCIWTETAED
jgi:hypothetical protein